jgi:iron complex outermembrane receptor protein
MRTLAIPLFVGAVLGLLGARAAAAPPAPREAVEPQAEDQEPLIITATRISEDVALVPAAVTVIGGAELRARGAGDLRAALALASGVDIAPGGDSGPGGSIPEFWGIKEFDAFLLVVDGVPWGGAFNPALSEIDLHDVERIEVLRGSAPVMYGATSFVGVIHVIHKNPSKVEASVRGFAGSYGSRGLGVSAPLSSFAGIKSALSADMEQQGFADPKTKFRRDHAAWRGEKETSAGKIVFGADGTFLRENPASPSLLVGTSLSGQVPRDTNQNLADAFINEDRVNVHAGLDHDFAGGTWSTLVSYTHTEQHILRGFLTDITANPDAHGFRENIGITDIYVDSHVQWEPAETWKVVSGLDHLHGRGTGRGGDFDYFINPDGSNAPSGSELPSQADVQVVDQRDFSGLYGFAEWTGLPFIVVEAGARLNRTVETRRTSNLALVAPNNLATGNDYRELWHGSGSAGVTWKAWQGGADLVNLFAGYKNTFKPAAVDFGLDTLPNILAPETAESFEAGAKSRWLDDRVDLNAEVFQIDFRNQVVATVINGNAGLENSGTTRSRGLELEAGVHPSAELTWQLAYSLQDARYRNFVDGGTQFGGNRLPTSARNMASTGLTYAPRTGWTAAVSANDVGSRFLDQANTALAKEYVTWSAGVGYRLRSWEVRVDGRNLNNQRVPVNASEMGTSQYYLLPARTVVASTSWKFL